MLPRYCIHTQMFREKTPGGNNAQEIERWFSVMGDTFHHMHHYCLGLMSNNRAMLLARDPQIRRFYLQNAIIEFDYILERAPQDFVLLPEVLTKKGENLIRTGKAPIGIGQLERAIELKPDYWPPYAKMSDYLKDKGDLQRAREILEKGLSAAPDAQALKRRLAELDTRTDKSRETATRY